MKELETFAYALCGWGTLQIRVGKTSGRHMRMGMGDMYTFTRFSFFSSFYSFSSCLVFLSFAARVKQGISGLLGGVPSRERENGNFFSSSPFVLLGGLNE